MKTIFSISIITLLVMISCSKREDKRLGQNYYKLALVELSEGGHEHISYKKALPLIEQALAYDKNAHFYALKASLLFKLGYYDESELCFKRALNLPALAHVKAEIRNNYACLLAHLKRASEANALWKELETSKDYLTPEVSLVNQGKLAVDCYRDYQRGHACFLKAISLAPNYLDAHYYAALTAYRLEDFACARNEVKTILFLEPHHQGARSLAQQLGLVDVSPCS